MSTKTIAARLRQTAKEMMTAGDFPPDVAKALLAVGANLIVDMADESAAVRELRALADAIENGSAVTDGRLEGMEPAGNA